MMTIEVLDAFLSKNKVYLKEPEKLMELREKAYGTLAEDKLFLSPYETFYLVEKRRARVTDEKTAKEKTLQHLVTRLSVGKPTIWTKYLVYRDLRDRGYLVRESEGGFDFETFGKGATRRQVSIVFEGSAKANKEGKDLVLAVIDRRTDIVYYTLNTERFEGK